MKKQRGFSLVEGLLIFIVIGAVGFGGWYVWDKNQDDSAINSDSSKQLNDIESLTQKMDGQILFENTSNECDPNDSQVCTDVQTLIFALSDQPRVDYVQFINNIESAGWLLNGEDTSELFADPQSRIDHFMRPSQYNDPELDSMDPKLRAASLSFAFITPRLLGGNDYLQKQDTSLTIGVGFSSNNNFENSIKSMFNSKTTLEKLSPELLEDFASENPDTLVLVLSAF